MFKVTNQRARFCISRLTNCGVIDVEELILLCHPGTGRGLELSPVTNRGPSTMLGGSRSLGVPSMSSMDRMLVPWLQSHSVWLFPPVLKRGPFSACSLHTLCLLYGMSFSDNTPEEVNYKGGEAVSCGGTHP